MDSIRNRATEMFPSVMLTVLSMVQALALELLWTRLAESSFLWNGGWDALLGWAQVLTVLLALLEVWLFYVSLVIRLTWVPSVYDSMLPFGIGIVEFSLIELTRPDSIGLWLCTGAVLLLVSISAGHQVARRARRHASNREFFAEFAPATRRDFMLPIIAAAALFVLAAAVELSGEPGLLALGSIAFVIGLIVQQAELTRRFWKQSISDAPKEEPDEDAEP
jgi:hypothetical protein